MYPYKNKLAKSRTDAKIAKRLGVSDVSVHNFAKQYNLNKPPRGYWLKNGVC